MSIFYINLEDETEDRYDLSKFMNFTDNYDPLTSDLLSELKNLPFGGRFKIRDEANRPDKASLAIYKTFQYWWILLYYNGMTSPDQFTLGKTIEYPLLSDLENYYFSLSVKQLRIE